MAVEVVDMVAFADGPGGGNPCPVVLGAEGWTTERIRRPPRASATRREALEVTGFYPYALVGDGVAAARQFPLRAGYDEDPATGVAACALAAHLAALAQDDGRDALTVLQGRALGRPSRIEAEAVREGDAITATRVGGRAARA